LLVVPLPHVAHATPSTGVVLTNWVDVIKVRQQLAGPEARNLASTAWHIVRSEGPLALQKGITPAVARGVLYGGEQSEVEWSGAEQSGQAAVHVVG